MAFKKVSWLEEALSVVNEDVFLVSEDSLQSYQLTYEKLITQIKKDVGG